MSGHDLDGDARLSALRDLLRELFDAEQLRRIIDGLDGQSRIADELPGSSASFAALVYEATRLLDMARLLDEVFFAEILRQRPNAYPEIQRVASLWAVALAPPPTVARVTARGTHWLAAVAAVLAALGLAVVAAGRLRPDAGHEVVLAGPGPAVHASTEGAHCGQSSATAARSCREILHAEACRGADDGSYWIDPSLSGQPVQVECDMTTESGGWTRLDGRLARLAAGASAATWDGAWVVGKVAPTPCAAADRPQYELQDVVLQFARAFALVERSEGLLLCSRIGGSPANGESCAYSDGFGSPCAPASICDWSPPAAPTRENAFNDWNRADLARRWRIIAREASKPLSYHVACSTSETASDQGRYRMAWYVR